MEERVISLKKGKTISLKKVSASGKKYKYIFTGLKWGKKPIYSTLSTTVSTEKKIYTGNFFQRLLKIGPFRIENNVIDDSNDRYLMGHKDVDLDSSILIYNSSKNLIETICYYNKNNNNKSIIHFGDDVRGGNKGKNQDNEIISLDFSKFPKDYKYVAVILNSYSHETFDEIPYVKMRIYTSDIPTPYTEKELLAEFNLSNIEGDENDFEGKGNEALVLGVFVRVSGDDWEFKSVGKFTKERSISSMSSGSVQRVINNL